MLALTPDKVSRTGEPPPTPTAAQSSEHSLIKLGDLPIKLTSGGSLADGRTYYVEYVDANSFQLRGTADGAVLGLSNTGLSTRAQHYFSPVVDLQVGSGDQILRIDLPAGATVTGTQSILGPGGVSLSLTAPPVGDGLSSATSRGSGGGFVGLRNNDATVNYNPTVSAYVASSVVDAGGEVTDPAVADGSVSVTTQLTTNAMMNSKNGTGGFVGIGDADAYSNQTVYNRAYIDDGVQLSARAI